MHFSVWAAAEVYSLQTQDAISSFKGGARALLISAQPASAELIDASPAKYWKNTKNWALFKDTATGALCLSVRGTATSGFLQSFADSMTNIDANAYNTTLFDDKVGVQSCIYSETEIHCAAAQQHKPLPGSPRLPRRCTGHVFRRQGGNSSSLNRVLHTCLYRSFGRRRNSLPLVSPLSL